MVVYERVEGSNDLVRAYSNAGYMIIQDETGDMYEEAIDPDYTNRTYTESDIRIPIEEENEEDAREAVHVLLDLDN